MAPQDDGTFTTFSADLTVARWSEGELIDWVTPEIPADSALAGGGGFTGHVALLAEAVDGTSTVHRFRLDDDVRVVAEVALDVRTAAAWPTGDAGVHVLTIGGEFRTYDGAGNLVRHFDAGPRSVQQSVDGDADGRRVVFGGPAGLLVVDVEGERSRVIAEAGNVTNVGLTPDGARAIVGTRDGVYRLWDLEDERAIGVLYDGNSSAGGPPGFEDDGRFAWLSTPGRAIRVPVEPDAWIERACEVAGRELTDAEWDEYVPGDVARGPFCG